MKHVANKVERWALRISGFRYEVVHISGEDNVLGGSVIPLGLS